MMDIIDVLTAVCLFICLMLLLSWFDLRRALRQKHEDDR